MDEADIRALSYRDCQKKCKELNISAKGKTSELQDKIVEYFGSSHASGTTEVESGTPIHDPGAENLPPVGQQVHTTPGSETKRRVLAQKAIDLAAKTPLPDQFGSMASPAPKKTTRPPAPVVKRSSGGCGLMLMFLLSSVLTAAVCMYTYRIKWDPVMKAGKEDIQAGLKEYTRQAQTLSRMDYADFSATKEWVTIKSKELYGEYSEKLRDFFGDIGSSSPSRSLDTGCQAAVNGFEIKFFAPSRTFSAKHEDHGKALMKMLMDLSNVHQRYKSVTHLVEYPASQDAVPSVEFAQEILGCEGTLAGQCMAIDFEELAEEEDQGAALQALVAPQLTASPSSMFFISNIEYMDSSGAAVLIALIGEHGVLNQPGCDISTQASAALIFIPVDAEAEPDIMETLEEFESTIANNVAVAASGGPVGENDSDGIAIDDNIMKEAQTTAAAIRRRVSENVLRVKPIGSIDAEGAAEADSKLSDKASQARAVSKPSAEDIAEAQKRRAATTKSGIPADNDAKEL